jgi:hypothetical protein
MALLSLEALGRRNVAGLLLLLNLALYVSMMGFASWALNSFVDDIGDQEYTTHLQVRTSTDPIHHLLLPCK